MYAIYFEFAREGTTDVYQCLFIPSTSIGAHTIKPTFAYKELTAARSRRVWEVKTNPIYRLSSEIPRDLNDLMGHEVSQLIGLSVYMTSILVAPDWRSAGVFPVEISTTDLLALKENETRMPADLNARIKTIREAKGFAPLPTSR
jgi:hypothetical protein